MNRLWGLVGVLVAVGLAPTGAFASDPHLPEGLRLCAGKPISLEVFSSPAGYEKESTGLAKALRKLTTGLGWMPRKDWRLIRKGRFSADLVHGELERRYKYWVGFERKGNKWHWVGSGDCTLEAMKEGASVGLWFRSRGQDYEATTKSIKVDVFEQSCSGGSPPTGRVLAPQVEYLSDSIVVTYFIKDQPGVFGCPGAPPVTRILRLSEPIGDRTVVDGSSYPFWRRMAAPGPEGFFDPTLHWWRSPSCGFRRGKVCVLVSGPSRVKVGDTATYHVRVTAKDMLTRVRLRAVLGADRIARRDIGPMTRGKFRKFRFKARCEAGPSQTNPKLKVHPTVHYATGGDGLAAYIKPRPKITCVPS